MCVGIGDKNGNSHGTSLAVQWLRLCTSIVGGTDLVPGWGTRIPHATWAAKKKKKKIKKKKEQGPTGVQPRQDPGGTLRMNGAGEREDT